MAHTLYKICYKTHILLLNNLPNPQEYLYLQRVFHGIRFKVNKGWSTAVLLFYLFLSHCYFLNIHKPKQFLPVINIH